MDSKELEKQIEVAGITADPIFNWVIEQDYNCS